MKDNQELIEILIDLFGTIEDGKGNEFSDVYLYEWDEIIYAVRDYDSSNQKSKVEMIKEKQRLIDVIAAKLSVRRNEYLREGNSIGIVMGNCLAAEQIIIQCKEMFEDTHNGRMVSPKDQVNIQVILDDIDYFLNKEAE